MFKSVLLVCCGIMLMAAASLDMGDYWASPRAATSNHHDWSVLEKNMRPEACAQCHESQFNDWKQSLHAQAFSPGMVGQFANMDHGAGSDCLRCHAPLEQQLFSSNQAVMQSLKTLRQHAQGFSAEADLESPQAKLPLRHAGVSCAVCHVRGGTRFGPPRLGKSEQGLINTPAHGGFIASKRFERSNFCAECHQFPQSYAINGKPLENTLVEWQQSRFARQGKQCQSCHMPNRKHAFKGIHDKDFTRKALAIKLEMRGKEAVLSITSNHIGHAFPTYVTPKITVKAEAMNAQQQSVQTWSWDIVREVFYGEGWQEKRDTRIFPDETRLFVANDIPKQATYIHFSIHVMPDYFYQGVYQSLLSEPMQHDAKALIQRALNTTQQRDYTLYTQTISFK